MSKSETGSHLTARLASWFERQKRVLPWRDEPTLYRVWISVIMLQQTQVATVVPYFERFIARLPSVEALAQASEDTVVQLWAGLGYYSRARNLHRAAQRIAENGFPRDREGWVELPGIGDYTAGAILSIALDQPEPILDGNVERVVSRLRRITRQKGDAEYKRRLWRLARVLVARAHGDGIRSSVLNQALMELGATVCTPRKPRCLLCPLRESCRAFAAGDAESFPPKKAKKQWVSVRERAVCAVDERGWVLLAKRAAGQWRAGLWDLPESWDAASAAAGVTPAMPAVIEELGEVETRHVVTRHKITRATQVVRVESGRHSAGVAAGAGRNSASGVAGRKKSAQLQAAEPTPVSMPVRAAASASAQAAETHHSANGAELRWVDVERTELALGSAFKKTWQTIRERFPEVSR